MCHPAPAWQFGRTREGSARMDDRTDRSLIAEIAANMRWARTTPDERRQATATAREAGRAALLLRFENEVDPDRVLDEIERTKRVRNLVSAHMAQMAREGA